MAQPRVVGTPEGKGKKRKCDLDTDTLECPNCLQPFSIPVYQVSSDGALKNGRRGLHSIEVNRHGCYRFLLPELCVHIGSIQFSEGSVKHAKCRNGHSTCSDCRTKLPKGCPTCFHRVGLTRNAAIEKVIQSLQVACKHALHGCATKLQYSDRDEIEEHENKLCEYRPLQCPLQAPKQCLHIGPGVTIPSHLAEKHGIKIIESCLGSGRSTCFTMKATCPMTLLKTEKAWLIVNCWTGLHNFGSYAFCTVFGSSKVKIEHKLSLERVKLRMEEKRYLTYTCMQAIAQSHSDLDFESITLADILVGSYINIPHEEQELSELEFEFKVTVFETIIS